jgi:uncharacterized repeat protein (TIGR02543 family)
VGGHGATPAAVWVEPGAPWLDEPEPRVSELGYTFGGWYEDAAFADRWDFAADTVTGPMTLYAKWTLNEYYISFDTGGFSRPAPATVKAGFATKITAPPPPSQDGYVFGGWYTDELCKGGLWNFTVDTVPPVDMTLYAKWTINTFTASFDLNGRGAPAPAPQRVTFGKKIAEPAPPSERGWTFGGWFTDAACTFGAQWDFAADTMPGHDQTLYAKWTMNGYRVYFNLNGHGAPAPASMIVQYGGKIPTPTQPSDRDWTFGGWFTDVACSPAAGWDFTTSTMPASDLTLYAKWTAKSAGGGNDDKDKDKEGDKDKKSDKDSDRNKENAGSNASGATGGGSNSNAEGGATTTDDATGGIADDDAYGEAGADNAGGDESEWHTNGGSAEAGEGKDGSGEEDMSIANILLMVAGIVIAISIAINARRRRYERWLPPTVITLGVFGAILYFVIEDINGAWVLINSHTIYFAIILAAQIAATTIGRGRWQSPRKKPEKMSKSINEVIK